MKPTFAVQAFVAPLVAAMIRTSRAITQRPRRNYILLTAFLCGATVLLGARAWRAGGDLLWEVATGGVLAASNGRAVMAGAAGVQIFDGESGNLLWQDSFVGVKTVVTDSRQVIAVGANAIRAYEARNGFLDWQSPLAAGTVINAAQMKGNQLLVSGTAIDATGTVQLLLRAYDVQNGQIDWEDQSLPPNTTGSAGSVSQKSLSIDGARAYVAATVGQGPFNTVACLVRAYDRSGGNLIWESVSNETCRANAVAAHAKQVILAGIGSPFPDDFLVRSYDANTGELLWQNRTLVSTGFDNEAVAVDDEGKRAFVAGWVRWVPGMLNQEAFLVRAYNMKTGELDWEDQYPGSIRLCLCHAHDIVVQDGRVYAVGGGVGAGPAVFIVRVYDAGSGKLQWQTDLPAGVYGDARSVAVDRGVVFAANAGVLRAFEAK